MPSLLNLFRGRKARPPSADAATAATSVVFVARRRQRAPLPLAAANCHKASDTNDYNNIDDQYDDDDSTSSPTATVASTSCWSSTSHDDGSILRSSDIRVSIVVKEAAPKAGGFFRRIVSMMRTPSNTAAAATGRGDKGPGAEDNDNNGTAESKAKGNDKGDNGLEQRQREADEEDEEDEEEPSVARPPPVSTCRRRRPPIRLRDVFCWPYAVDETDETAASAAAATGAAGRGGDVGRRTTLAASELECLYSVRQLQSLVSGAPDCQQAPAEGMDVPLGAGKAEEAKLVRQAVCLCIDSDESSSSYLRQQQQQQQRADTAERLRRTDVEEAESKDVGLEVGIGRLWVGSAEQRRRLRLRRSPGASKLDQCQQQEQQPEAPLGDDTFHRVSGRASASSSLDIMPAVAAAATSSPSAAADLSSVASADAGANSLSSPRHQHKHQQVFADLCLVNGVANSLTAVTHTTGASSSPNAVSSADRVKEPDDCSTE